MGKEAESYFPISLKVSGKCVSQLFVMDWLPKSNKSNSFLMQSLDKEAI